MAELPASVMADPEVRPTVKVVLAALYGMTHWADRADPFAWPSIAEVMRRCGLKRTAVVRAIGEAKASGIIRSDTRTTPAGRIQCYVLAPHDESGAVYRFEVPTEETGQPGRETGTPGRETGLTRPRDGHAGPRDGPVIETDQAARRARPGRETGLPQAARRASQLTPHSNPPTNPPIRESVPEAIERPGAEDATLLSIEQGPDIEAEPVTSALPGLSSSESSRESEPVPSEASAPRGSQRATQDAGALPLFGDQPEAKTAKPTRKRKPRLSDEDAERLLLEQNVTRRAVADRLRRRVGSTGMTPGIRKAMEKRIEEGYTLEQMLRAARVRKQFATEAGFKYLGTASFWAAKAIDFALGQPEDAQPEDESAGRGHGRARQPDPDAGLKVLARQTSAAELFGS